MTIESTTPSAEILESGLTAIYITASWCGPCKSYGPQVEQLSVEFPNVKFVKCDADAASTDISDLVVKHKTMLRSVPTTLFFEDGELRDAFVGADISKLRKLIVQFS